MSNEVQFDIDIDNEQRAEVQKKIPRMVKLVIKLSGGLIKNEAQANYVLISLAVTMFAISIFLFRVPIRSPAPLPADQIIQITGPEAKIGDPSKLL